MTFRFGEQAKVFTRRLLYTYRMDLQTQWNLHIKQKVNQYTDQSYSECVQLVVFKGLIENKIGVQSRSYEGIYLPLFVK